MQNLFDNFEAEIGSLGSENVPIKTLSCGSEIHQIFHEWFGQFYYAIIVVVPSFSYLCSPL